MTDTCTVQALMDTEISSLSRLMNRKKKAAPLKEIMFNNK